MFSLLYGNVRNRELALPGKHNGLPYTGAGAMLNGESKHEKAGIRRLRRLHRLKIKGTGYCGWGLGDFAPHMRLRILNLRHLRNLWRE